MDPWDRISVDHWTLFRNETIGGEGGQWLKDDQNVEWLHKHARIQEDGAPDGEDWAEVAATTVASTLGVPAAETRLCMRAGRNGSLSRKIHNVHEFSFMEGGLHLLDRLDVVVGDEREGSVKRVRTGHSLDKIHASLEGVRPPPGVPDLEEFSAFDVFAGYLCLDALIANRDRHEQNWAVLEPAGGAGDLRLAPSFDHAGAFGYNMRPSDRQRKLQVNGALQGWAQRGTAWRIEHRKPPGPVSLVDLATEALRLASTAARAHWIDAIASLDPGMLRRHHETASLVLSADILDFAERVLQINQERLAHAASNL